jgi:hypothetical protein
MNAHTSTYSTIFTAFLSTQLRILIIFLIGIFSIFSPQLTTAQGLKKTDSTFCASPELTDGQRIELDELAKFAFELKKASGKVFTDIVHIPLRPHIFRQANGTGGFDMARLNNVIALTNSYYQANGVGIQFYLAGTSPDYIDDDTMFNGFVANSEAALAGRDATTAMNMFFVNAFSDPSLGGYAYFPNNTVSSTRSFILTSPTSTENDLGNRLIPHEMGHNFNLFHTFQGSTGSTPELVTRGVGANCTSAGDFLCDTPADPYGRTGASLTFVAGCPAYKGTATDPTGMTYSPSISNIMSYYFPCTHDFTQGQQDRLQAGLALRQSHTAYSLNFPPSIVNAPTNLQATVGTSRYVIVTWRDNASNEMGYFVERATSAAGPFVPIGGTAPNIAYFTDTKAPIPGTYFYRVRPSNTTTGAISNVVGVTVSAAGVCLAKMSLGCAQGDGLTTLFMNGQPLSQQSGCAANAYHEFPVASLTVAAGQTCYLSGQFLNTVQAEGVSVWFDLNRDGVYATTERYFSAIGTGIFSGSLTLPTTLTAGAIGMRVVITKNVDTFSNCLTTAYGETEDYTIMVQANICAAPGGLTSTSIAARSAQLNWASAAGAVSYELRWKLQDNSPWTTVTGLTSTAYALSNLITGGGYQWEVRAVCGAGNSAYSGQTFTTICPAPTSLVSSTITANSAMLSWSDLGTGYAYDLIWRIDNASTWQTVSGLSVPNYVVTGLREGTIYSWQVRSVCSPTGSQTYVAPVTFSTPGLCRPASLRGCTDSDGLNSFSFNNVPLSTNSGCSVSGYERFSSSVAPVSAGQPYSFSGTLLSNSYYEGVSIWLDLNRNGAFETAERLFSTPGVVADTFSGTLTIPSGLTVGTLPMRVVVTYNTVPTDACGNYYYSETEDYVLNVYPSNVIQVTRFANPACPNTPLPVSFGAIGFFGATNVFTVELSDAAGSFPILPTQLGSVTATTGSSLTVTIPGSVPVGNNYLMRVVSSNPVASNTPSVPVRITSVCSCPTPTSLVAANQTGSVAGLSWVSTATVNSYSLRWRIQGGSTWNTITGLLSPTYFMTNLMPGTTYEWQVLANCVNGQASAWSASATFQTVSCGTATLLGASQTVVAGQPVSLTVVLTGQNPWSYQVYSNGTYLIGANGITTSPVVFTTSVPGSATLTLGPVSNACGLLSGSGTVMLTVPCVAPTSLTETNQTATSVEARWVSVPGNTYQVQWKESSATSWNQSSAACCSPYYIGGLELGKTYQWCVRTICPDGATSTWSASRTVTTGCPVPSGQSELISPTQAVLRWSYMSNSGTSLLYNLQWRVMGTSTWTTVSNTCCSEYTVSGLAMGQAYEWQLQTVCPNASTSVYSVPRSFTTQCGTPQPNGWGNQTPSSIRLYWTSTPGCVAQIRMRVTGTAAWAESGTTLAGATFVDISGLTNATSYEWQIRAICASGTTSAYSASSFFTAACTVPYSLSAAVIGSTSALVGWLGATDSGYEVRHRVVGGSSWTITPPTSATNNAIRTLTGLTGSTAYEWQVRTICSGSATSAFSGSATFTTSANAVVACQAMISVKTGLWTDPTVWSCNRVPVATDVVTIVAGHVVTVPTNTVAHAANVIQYGMLTFVSPNAVLRLSGLGTE